MVVLEHKRGSTLYIPIVMPDNWQLGIGHLLGIVTFILLMISISSTAWCKKVYRSTALSYSGYDLQLEIEFALRTFHITICEYQHGTQPTSDLNNCGWEDSFYSDCGENNSWCLKAQNPSASFYILLVAGIGVILGGLASMMKNLFLPSGHLLAAIAVLLSVLGFMEKPNRFVPSSILSEWIGEGVEVSNQYGTGFKLAVSAAGCLCLSVILGLWGERVQARVIALQSQEDAHRDEAREQELTTTTATIATTTSAARHSNNALTADEALQGRTDGRRERGAEGLSEAGVGAPVEYNTATTGLPASSSALAAQRDSGSGILGRGAGPSDGLALRSLGTAPRVASNNSAAEKQEDS